MASEAPGPSVHVVGIEAGSDRARELAPALRAAGRSVHEAVLGPGAAPGDGEDDRLRAELAFTRGVARAVADDGGALLLADERAALAVPELLRILLDERGLGWDEAWERVRAATFARFGSPRNESSLPHWRVSFLEREQPRLLEILYEINRRQLEEAERTWPGDLERRRRLSLFREGEPKRLRPSLLALAAAGRADVATPWEGPNAEVLGELMVLRGRALRGRPTPLFARAWLEGNAALTQLLRSALGAAWQTDRELFSRLETLAFDASFRLGFGRARRANRERLARLLREQLGLEIDPDGMVDVRIGALDPRERPLLSVLGIVREHLRVAAGGWTPPAPRTVVLARVAEAARGPRDPLLELALAVGAAVNADARARASLRVAVLPACDVETERLLAAAADLSNQPGTAGSGAAGARALGLAVNGAATLGTRDGTVRELELAVGAENLFLYGLGPLETRSWREGRVYRPQDVYAIDPLVRLSLDALVSRRYARDPDGFLWARRQLLDERDPWLVLADLGAYVHRQDEALAEFADPRAFSEKAIVALARSRALWVDALDPGR